MREARRISTASETLAEGEPANSSEKTIIPRRYRAIHLCTERSRREGERERERWEPKCGNEVMSIRCSPVTDRVFLVGSLHAAVRRVDTSLSLRPGVKRGRNTMDPSNWRHSLRGNCTAEPSLHLTSSLSVISHLRGPRGVAEDRRTGSDAVGHQDTGSRQTIGEQLAAVPHCR